MEQRPYFKAQAVFKHLPDLIKQLNALQKEVEELKRTNNIHGYNKTEDTKGSFSLWKRIAYRIEPDGTFNPAPENTGYKIQRIDLDGQPIIDAVKENVVDNNNVVRFLAKGDARGAPLSTECQPFTLWE